MTKLSRVLLALGVMSCMAMAQDQPAPVKIKKVPVSSSNPASGQQMFAANCGACHGLDGKGDGPAVPALKVAPPDLTLLAQKNGGKFPTFEVQNSIRGDANTPAAHGSVKMPVWGELFRSVNSDDAMIQLRVHNLAKYIETLQQK